MKNPESTAGRPPSAEMLFRYLVVSKVLARQERGLVRAKAVSATVAEGHLCFDSTLRHVSARTVYRWLNGPPTTFVRNVTITNYTP